MANGTPESGECQGGWLPREGYMVEGGLVGILGRLLTLHYVTDFVPSPRIRPLTVINENRLGVTQ